MFRKSPVSHKIKIEVLNRDSFVCQKCDFKGRSEDLEICHIKMRVNGGKNESTNLITLCNICHYYSPDNEKEFKKYIEEKIDGNVLSTFRNSQRSISKRTKKGMVEKSEEGYVVSRAPFGYKIVNKKLVQREDSYIVQEIFHDFLNTETSLTNMAKKYGLSVNGLKKVLKNQTYLGKVKFDGLIHQGSHKPLISSTLFNHVQNKLEKMGIK